VLAYVSWHRPAPGVEPGAYEHSLEHFHRSLAHRPPSGLRGSASFRAPLLPWLKQSAGTATDGDASTVTAGPTPQPPDLGAQGSFGYEDWYLLDGWSGVGVLEEAAVSQGHLTAHDAVAKLAGPSTGAVYRLGEGHCELSEVRVAVWVGRERGHASPTLADLLGDGMDRSTGGLWRRCVGLGPAPEYCLLVDTPPAGVAQERLPAGWSAESYARELLWHG
jgi:hypothetical protein